MPSPAKSAWRRCRAAARLLRSVIVHRCIDRCGSSMDCAVRAVRHQWNDCGRAARRRERIASPVSDLEVWMRAERVKVSPIPRSPSHGLHAQAWEAFTRFLGDGRICLTNNAAERELRGIALGRKSWLFAGSDSGGERAAVIYRPRNSTASKPGLGLPICSPASTITTSKILVSSWLGTGWCSPNPGKPTEYFDRRRFRSAQVVCRISSQLAHPQTRTQLPLDRLTKRPETLHQV
jgi:Transposase IS66 family